MATKDITDEQVVDAAKAEGRTLDVLIAATGQPEKVCYRAIERSIRNGFVESGVSVATAWAVD